MTILHDVLWTIGIVFGVAGLVLAAVVGFAIVMVAAEEAQESDAWD